MIQRSQIKLNFGHGSASCAIFRLGLQGATRVVRAVQSPEPSHRCPLCLTSWQYCRMPSLVPMQLLVPEGSVSHLPLCTLMCMFSFPQNMATWGSASRPMETSVGTCVGETGGEGEGLMRCAGPSCPSRRRRKKEMKRKKCSCCDSGHEERFSGTSCEGG